MTHLYIKICDLCKNASEMNSQSHSGCIRADVRIQKKKTSYVVFREEFDVCISCMKKTGLSEILLRMKEQKEKNDGNVKIVQKLLSEKQGHLR